MFGIKFILSILCDILFEIDIHGPKAWFPLER